MPPRLLVTLVIAGGVVFFDAAASCGESEKAARISMLIKQMDSDKFAERESAALELTAIGQAALPALEKELASKPSLEVRRRLEILIEEISVELASPLIALLDEEEFAVRQKAHEELEQLGERARPALQRALLKSPSVEVQSRVKALLGQIEIQPKKPKE